MTALEDRAREIAADRIRAMSRAKLIELLSSTEREEKRGVWVRGDAILVPFEDIRRQVERSPRKPARPRSR